MSLSEINNIGDTPIVPTIIAILVLSLIASIIIGVRMIIFDTPSIIKKSMATVSVCVLAFISVIRFSAYGSEKDEKRYENLSFVLIKDYGIIPPSYKDLVPSNLDNAKSNPSNKLSLNKILSGRAFYAKVKNGKTVVAQIVHKKNDEDGLMVLIDGFEASTSKKVQAGR